MSVPAQLEFIQWDERFLSEQPYALLFDVPGVARTNTSVKYHKVEIRDLRDRESSLDLEVNGYKLVPFPNPETFDDPTRIETGYLPEVKRLMKQYVEDVDEVVVFSWRRRRAEEAKNNEKHNHNDRSAFMTPATLAHIDNSPAGILGYVKELFGERADEALQRRVRAYNLWRPSGHVVHDWPLTICDGRSVDTDKLVEVQTISPRREGAALWLQHSAGLHWTYIREQRPDEAWLFKQFDSQDSAKVRFVPHGSFKHPKAPVGVAPRESIEVRMLVFGPKMAGDVPTVTGGKIT